MDGFNVGLIVVVILSIVAYIAQNIMVKKLWQTKGINLSSNRIILGMAGLGFFILCVFIYGKSLGMSLGSVMGDLGTIGWVIAIITIACFAYVHSWCWGWNGYRLNGLTDFERCSDFGTWRGKGEPRCCGSRHDRHGRQRTENRRSPF